MNNYSNTLASYDSDDIKGTSRRQFIVIVLYLIFEYGRPQTFFPPLSAIRPAMIIQLLMIYYVITPLISFNFKRSQTKVFFFLLLLMIPHVPLAHNNYWAFNILKIMFLYFIVHLTIITFITEFSSILKITNIWLIIIFICGVIGVLYGGKIPGSSIMGDENDFSLVLNMAIPIAFFLGMETDNKKIKIYYYFATGIFIIGTILSFSRGGFVGLASVGLYCWIKSPKKIVSSIIIAIFILLMSLAAPEKYWDEVKSITEENIEEGTGATRWYTWQCGWKMFLDYPIFGVGQGNFPWNFEKYEPPEGFRGRLHGGRAAHSIYFTLIPELGLVGTFLFFFITYKTMRESKYLITEIKSIEKNGNNNYTENSKKKLVKVKYILYGLRGALIGYLVSGIFLSVLYYPHYWLIVSLFLCIFNLY
jgi:probable O-glycosylation ligase (exosortase A-associated)